MRNGSPTPDLLAGNNTTACVHEASALHAAWGHLRYRSMNQTAIGAAATGATPFTLAGVRRGFVTAQPLAFGALIYGITFGVLALGSGLSVLQAMVMSLTVYSGSGQTAAVGAIASGAGIFATVVTVTLLNARYVLYGAALRPWLSGTSPAKAYATLYLLGDGNWLMSVNAHAAGEEDAGFLLGSGFAMFFPWMAGTFVGALTGGWIPNPQALALDFFLIAFCAAMLAGMMQAKPGYLSALAALVAALATDRFFSGGWPIVAAGVAGMLVGYARNPQPAPEAA